ncbi:hypothetical protein [Bacillus sp. FJAT-28004]|uniref:hypothetical protein n=1 Tax=Bacillus sp. FJAT-28004 TaxID=1679165 RepID=UPI0006B45A16|nr:hypothetical protein [Bacillus sp. FJAT-28004]
MKLESLREWLIAKGIPAMELDEVSEPPVIRDIGEALTLSLQNDDMIGAVLVEMMLQIAELQAEVSALKGGNA